MSNQQLNTFLNYPSLKTAPSVKRKLKYKHRNTFLNVGNNEYVASVVLLFLILNVQNKNEILLAIHCPYSFGECFCFNCQLN